MTLVGSAAAPGSVRHTQRALVHSLNEIAKAGFSVKFLGEDDNGDATFHHRAGRGGPLTAEKFLKAAGYKDPAKQTASDEFSFQPVRAADWQNIIDSQDNPAAATQLKDLLAGMDVAMATVKDPQPFGARGYLVASDRAGNMYMFRGVVGGMGF